MVRATKDPGQVEPTRVEVWEEWTTWPLFVLSIVFVTISSTVVIAKNELSTTVTVWSTIGVILMWAIFIGDFLVRMRLSKEGRGFVRRNLFELVSLFIPVLRAFLLVLYLWRLPVFRKSHRYQRLRFITTAGAFGLIFVYVAAMLVWLVEHQAPGANILHFGDALWWGFATIATVGYGDYTPITVPGRVIAVGLMLGGIVIVGVTSATVISALTEQVQAQRDTILRKNQAGTADAQRSESQPGPEPEMGTEPDAATDQPPAAGAQSP